MTDTGTDSVAGDEIRAFVERYERLEAEKKDITEAQAEVMSEAKGRGYEVKVLRKIIAIRKMDPDDRAELNALEEMYLAALGMN
jgi:uncharacterized protein (UPF0335 family)